MTTKEWLNRGRILVAETNDLLHAGSDRSDVDCKLNEWLSVLIQMVNEIYQMDDRRERIVLLDYFCNRLTVREIAADLNLTMEHTFRIKRAAIKHLGECLGKITAT